MIRRALSQRHNRRFYTLVTAKLITSRHLTFTKQKFSQLILIFWLQSILILAIAHLTSRLLHCEQPISFRMESMSKKREAQAQNEKMPRWLKFSTRAREDVKALYASAVHVRF